VDVEAVLTADSTLLLPAAPVSELLGLPTPTSAWLTVAQLQKMFPPIQVTWQPRALTVVIRDDLLALPASRATRDALMRTAQGAAPLTVITSGPFLALTANDLGRQLVEGGYSYKGKVAVSGQRSDRGTLWGVSLVPGPWLFAALTGGSAQPIAVNLRLAKGPVWVQSAWNAQTRRLQADGLVQLGRLSVFVSSRDAFALTINALPVGLQLGRTGKRTTAKLTYGPISPSPFSVPAVP
jgi:hypothetical protein